MATVMCEPEELSVLGGIGPKTRGIDQQIDDFDAIGIE
jgi:hypothetical protein